jgi:hypothetical protein
MKYKIKKFLNNYNLGKSTMNNPFHVDASSKTKIEKSKMPIRTDVINFLLSTFDREVHYLEIGVRFPEHNFNHIIAKNKYSVDPGFENTVNPVDFKMTSDTFFEQIKSNQILDIHLKFDVIFIDGLHLADQVERDINNALDFLSEDGFIVLHDCNPPTEFHARESFQYFLSPAKGSWNGTTWKAFFKIRQNSQYHSCCIDSDFGIGIISKKYNFGPSTNINNPYFEYHIFNENRTKSLNLLSYEDFKVILIKF